MLYRGKGGHKEYCSVWYSEQENRATIYHGKVGSPGKATDLVLSDKASLMHAIEQELGVYRSLGFTELSPAEESCIIVQCPESLFASPIEALRHRHAVEALLDARLQEVGVGICDGGEIGDNAVNSYFFVVDIQQGISLVRQSLEEAGLLSETTIAVLGEENDTVVWPIGFEGTFSLGLPLSPRRGVYRAAEPSEAQLQKEVLQLARDHIYMAPDRYRQIRRALYESYGWQELDVLRAEICYCLVFGLHQAAITLTNHLLESFSKYTLIRYHIVLNGEESTLDAINMYGTIKLDNAINRACSLGLIDKSTKKELHDFRIKFRNPYFHASKAEMIAVSEIRRVSFYDLDSMPLGEKAPNDPLHQSMAQVMYSYNNAERYFLDMDAIIRITRQKVFTP